MASAEEALDEAHQDPEDTDHGAAGLVALGQVKGRECMRFAHKSGGEWRMGCELVSPVDGSSKYTPDVLRSRTLTGADRVAVEAHLWDSREVYIKLCSKKDVRAKLSEWVQEQRESNPDFWMNDKKRGPKKVTSTTPVDVRDAYHERMRLARESGKQWAGKRLKDLMAQGHSRSTGLVGKPYIARLLQAHERLLKSESIGGEVHPQRAKGRGARILRLFLPEQRELQRNVSEGNKDDTPLVELLTPEELQHLGRQRKWQRKRYAPHKSDEY
jgi:hypothetical protein